MKFPLSLASGLVLLAVAAFPVTAQAQSRIKECAAEWQQAKAANTTGGKTYRQFSKECLAQKKAAAGDKPAESKPAVTAPATEATKKPATGGRAAMTARLRACAADWKADKAAGKTAGLKWPKYWSDCNKRKKEQGM
jgi:hypothetical protein